MNRFAKCIFLVLALLVAADPASEAQPRYAAFIHGFSFGDSRPQGVRDGKQCKSKGPIYEGTTPFRKAACNQAWEKAGSRWEASETPDRWEAGSLDGSIKLKYFDRDLYDDAGTEQRDVTLDPTRQAMMRRFVEKMKHTAPNAEWVLVGHSQGGIVARLLHEHIREHRTGVDVEGVLAIASPMQGAKPATVSYGGGLGYTNVKPIIDGFLKDLLVGPLGDASGSLLNFTIPGFGVVFDILSNFWDPIKYAAEGVIDLSQGMLKKLNEMTVEKAAKEAIGPHGELIEAINRAPNPDAYRALLGAERSPVAARVASGRKIEEGRVVTFGFWGGLGLRILEQTGRPNFELAQIFKGSEQVAPGEEPVTVDFFREVKSAYTRAADYYRYRCYGSLGLSCVLGDHQKWKRWKQGRRAIQNFGSTYTEIINSFRLEVDTRQTWVCRGGNGHWKNGASGRRGSRGFSAPSAREYVNQRLSEEECFWKTKTYYVTVPDKNDGLLGTATQTWNPKGNDGPNLGPHSILYNDRSSSNRYKRGGTGYNHAEMVYDRRRYSSSEDPGIGGDDPSFGEGDRNPPMREGEDWLDNQVFGLP